MNQVIQVKKFGKDYDNILIKCETVSWVCFGLRMRSYSLFPPAKGHDNEQSVALPINFDSHWSRQVFFPSVVRHNPGI